MPLYPHKKIPIYSIVFQSYFVTSQLKSQKFRSNSSNPHFSKPFTLHLPDLGRPATPYKTARAVENSSAKPWPTRISATVFCFLIDMAVCQNLVPLVNIKIAGKWKFIPLKMVCIGIDPYPYWDKLNYVFHWDFQGCVFIFLILWNLIDESSRDLGKFGFPRIFGDFIWKECRENW